jgi:putative transcriptional regulator
MANHDKSSFFESLKAGLEECIEHVRGERALRTISIPRKPPEVDAATVTAIRAKAKMSQAIFARLLNVSTKTIQSWEQGVRSPSHASQRLIQVLAEHPDVVFETAGMPQPKRKSSTQAARTRKRRPSTTAKPRA